MAYESDLNLQATELRLGLPGSDVPEKPSPTPSTVRGNKRASPERSGEYPRSKTNSSASTNVENNGEGQDNAPPAKAQVVGWPPIQSYRRDFLQPRKTDQVDGAGMYVKVSMDGAPYLRKIDLKVYKSYPELLKALEDMFKLTIGDYSEKEGYNGPEYAPAYEDKDGDWMLVGDVPWDMFMSSCTRLRIMKGSDARGLAC